MSDELVHQHDGVSEDDYVDCEPWEADPQANSEDPDDEDDDDEE